MKFVLLLCTVSILLWHKISCLFLSSILLYIKIEVTLVKKYDQNNNNQMAE